MRRKRKKKNRKKKGHDLKMKKTKKAMTTKIQPKMITTIKHLREPKTQSKKKWQQGIPNQFCPVLLTLIKTIVLIHHYCLTRKKLVKKNFSM